MKNAEKKAKSVRNTKRDLVIGELEAQIKPGSRTPGSCCSWYCV